MIRAITLVLLICLLLAGPAMAGRGLYLDEEDEERVELPPCVPDDNDTSVDAVELDTTSDLIIEVVCPDDPIDYYYFEVPPGADVAGEITFISNTVGTVVRLTREGSTLFEQSTTGPATPITIPVSITESAGATFYLRITYYSAYEGTHYYGIWPNITLSGCYEEGNASKDDADRIFFGDSSADSFCESDTVDWYWFHINTDKETTEGWLRVDPCTLPSRVTVYNNYDMQLFSRILGDSAEKFKFSDYSGFVRFNRYYVKLEILDSGSDDTDEYTIRLGSGDITSMAVLSPSLSVLRFPIWPSPNHDAFQTARTFSRGPSGPDEITHNRFSDESIFMPQHPVVGPSGEIYVIDREEPSDKLIQVDYNGDILWTKRLQGHLDGPFLDSSGIWTANDDYIYHFNYKHNQTPPIALPDGMAYTTELIGVYNKYLYFISGQDGFQLWCLEMDGDVIYMADAMGNVYNIAVDRKNNVYCTSHYNITKFDSSGNALWRDWYFDAHRAGDVVPRREGTIEYSPHIGKDMKVFKAARKKFGYYRFHLYNPDGTEYEGRDVYLDEMPRAIATDLNGNYYFADFGNNLKKFDATLTHQWTGEIPGLTQDMLIDGSGRIFVAYGIGGGLNIFAIKAFDTEGNVLWHEVLEGINNVGQIGWLLVGSDRRLIFMTSGGDLVTIKGVELDFEPATTPGPLESAGGSSTKRILNPLRPIGDR